VEEQPNGAAVTPLAQTGGKEQQMVVVGPYRAVGRHQLGGGLGQAVVDRDVGFPFGVLEPDPAGQHVEEGPEASVAEPVVVALVRRFGQVDPRQRWTGAPIAPDSTETVAGQGAAAPAEPQPAAAREDRLERGDQASHRTLAFLLGRDGFAQLGQAVRHGEQTVSGGVASIHLCCRVPLSQEEYPAGRVDG
jgi:hypothetical protein